VSVAGAERWNGPPFDYVAGKSARNSFVRSLAGQEISNGITCNIVAPGKTPHVTLKQAVDAAKHGGNWKRRTHAVPQDVADVVRFLCSEEASFVTGNVIELSGS
jgi:3-oxoacyl-[acyl-carrier protein] reductase